MKTTNIFLAAALTAFMFSACSSDDAAVGQSPIEGEVPVTLTSTTVQAISRAATNLNETKLTSGDVSVFISTNYATQYTYTAQSDGSLTSASTAYYPNDGSSIDIVACHPATASSDATSAATFEVGEDQSSADNYIASDLLWAQATGKTKASGSVALAFQHKMAKIIVNVTAGSGVSTVGNITLKNIKRRTTFTASTGVMGTASSVAGHTDVLLGGNNNAAVIPAQELSGEFLSIVTDQGTAVYSFNSAKAVTAGNYYQLNITVNRTNVGVTNTVSAWSGSGTINITPNLGGQTFDVTNNRLMKFIANGVSFTMVGVKGGAYTTLGGVTVTGTLSDYYIGETEVTNALYKAVNGSTPSASSWTEDDCPAQYMSRNDLIGTDRTGTDASCFIYKLNQLLADQLPSGYKFMLPSDAQWEYAARGGSKSKGYTYCGSSTVGDVAWYGNGTAGTTTEGSARTHPVATLIPNELGLYDMSGNVWEWVLDNSDAPSANQNLGADFVQSGGSNGVFRGGSWADTGLASCTPALRNTGHAPTLRIHNVGFRLALVQE